MDTLPATSTEGFAAWGELHNVLTGQNMGTTFGLDGPFTVAANDAVDNLWSNWSDQQLSQSLHTYNPFLDSVGEMPRAKRILAADGMIFLVTDIYAQADPDLNWHESAWLADSIRWSTTTRNEPENFPVQNVYRPDDPGDKFLCLEKAGDYVFAISRGSVVRIARSGSQVGVVTLQQKMGGVSRHGAIGVGASLFLVTNTGLKEIDGNTGAVQSIAVVDRVIFDDREWGQDLEAVHIEYDAHIGALILLNTVKKECIILWEATGQVTTLEDCPWAFLTGGSDAKTGGPRRAYFIADNGDVKCIDASRDMGRSTMCGATNSESVNGGATSDSSSNQLIDEDAVFPASCVGHEIYFHSGDNASTSVTITDRVSDTQVSLDSLSDDIAIGDRYSVAPVVFRVTLPQLWGNEGRNDEFLRKQVKSVSVSFNRLSGAGSDEETKMRVGFYRNATKTAGLTETPLEARQTNVASIEQGVQLYPYIEFKGANIDFELQSVLVHGKISGSEA